MKGDDNWGGLILLLSIFAAIVILAWKAGRQSAKVDLVRDEMEKIRKTNHQLAEDVQRLMKHHKDSSP